MAGVSETRTLNAVLSTTLDYFEKDLQDQIFDDYPLLSWMNGKLGRGTRTGQNIKQLHDGGNSIYKHLAYEINSTAGPYSGADLIDTTIQDGITMANYVWKQYAGTISITGLDRMKNKGKARLINLLEAKRNQAIMTLKNSMSQDAFGDGTGTGGKALTGLAALISASTTVGGLSTTTYTWWKSHSASVGSWTANGRAKLRTAVNTLTFGNDKPSIMFTDQTTYEYIQAAEETKERFSDRKTLELGFDNIVQNGIPILFDRDCTAGTIYLLNGKNISFDVDKDTDLVTEPFQSPVDQDVSTAKILWYGNMCVNNRRRHGILTGITA